MQCSGRCFLVRFKRGKEDTVDEWRVLTAVNKM
jgi:hypothetical protein